MTDSEKFITILLAGGVALFATIFCTDSSAKMRRVAGKLDVAIDDLSDKNEVELEKCVIEKAVQKSVERKVNDIVGSASKYAIDRVADVMTDKVKSEVDASYTDIRKSVSRRVDQEIKDYDVTLLHKYNRESLERRREMRIIKEGRKELANPELKFICYACKCEFTEHVSLCRRIMFRGYDDYYKTKCPCCGNDCYSSEMLQ